MPAGVKEMDAVTAKESTHTIKTKTVFEKKGNTWEVSISEIVEGGDGYMLNYFNQANVSPKYFSYSDKNQALREAEKLVQQLSNTKKEFLKAIKFYAEGSKETKKRWVTLPIDTTCPSCKALNGRVIKSNEMFSDPKGVFDDVYGPPLHPNCRCKLERVK